VDNPLPDSGGIAEHGLWVSTNASVIQAPNIQVSFNLGCNIDGEDQKGWAKGVPLLHTGG